MLNCSNDYKDKKIYMHACTDSYTHARTLSHTRVIVGPRHFSFDILFSCVCSECNVCYKFPTYVGQMAIKYLLCGSFCIISPTIVAHCTDT